MPTACLIACHTTIQPTTLPYCPVRLKKILLQQVMVYWCGQQKCTDSRLVDYPTTVVAECTSLLYIGRL